MTWLAFISLAWFIVVLYLNLKRDLGLYKLGLMTNHNNRFWVRLFMLLPCVYGFAWAYDPRLTWWLPVHLCLCGIMVGLTWMPLFNGIYNIRRNFNWFYVGSDGDEDGVIEDYLQRWPWIQYIVHVLAGASVYLYVKMF